jgi:purine-cytosine permease-like protein
MADEKTGGHKIRFGSHVIRLPRAKLPRVLLGIGLVIGGLLWFLPVLGLWMLPLGIMVLSIDYHPLRRQRRRFETWWGRWRQRRAAARNA